MKHLFFLGYLLLPMLATATIATLHRYWCGDRRRMIGVACIYLVCVALPHYWVTRSYVLPAERDYNPDSPANFWWALAISGVVRFIDLGFGPGFVFLRCWRGQDSEG